ncbi:hypothetical protein NUW58_g1371 [Xylaria curta]|uniref:Uncharacterized protein n=1 Tax=Xylaria curta TaxID=42375 RepID=A0ACC1PLN7_9PEZI|nr:hypothetical protein NUW58_g1371 [Xylaria curta]
MGPSGSARPRSGAVEYIAQKWLDPAPPDRLSYPVADQADFLSLPPPSVRTGTCRKSGLAVSRVERALATHQTPHKRSLAATPSPAWAAGVDNGAVSPDNVLGALLDNDMAYAIEDGVDDRILTTWGLAGGGNINDEEEEGISDLLTRDDNAQMKGQHMIHNAKWPQSCIWLTSVHFRLSLCV